MRALPETVLSTGSSSPFSRLGHRWVWPRAAGLGLGEACPAFEAHAGVPGSWGPRMLRFQDAMLPRGSTTRDPKGLGG